MGQHTKTNMHTRGGGKKARKLGSGGLPKSQAFKSRSNPLGSKVEGIKVEEKGGDIKHLLCGGGRRTQEKWVWVALANFSAR